MTERFSKPWVTWEARMVAKSHFASVVLGADGLPTPEENSLVGKELAD